MPLSQTHQLQQPQQLAQATMVDVVKLAVVQQVSATVICNLCFPFYQQHGADDEQYIDLNNRREGGVSLPTIDLHRVTCL